MCYFEFHSPKEICLLFPMRKTTLHGLPGTEYQEMCGQALVIQIPGNRNSFDPATCSSFLMLLVEGAFHRVCLTNDRRSKPIPQFWPEKRKWWVWVVEMLSNTGISCPCLILTPHSIKPFTNSWKMEIETEVSPFPLGWSETNLFLCTNWCPPASC